MSTQSKRLAKQLKAAKAATKSMAAAVPAEIIHKQNPSGAETHEKPKQPPRKRLSFGYIWKLIFAFFGFSLAGALNYFGSNPRILYLPAFGFCILICFLVMWGTHKFVNHKIEDLASNPIAAVPQRMPVFTSSTNLTPAEKAEFAKIVEDGIAAYKSSDFAFDQFCPGFSADILLRLHPPEAGRNNFIFDTGESVDRDRISIFIDPDGNLCFRVIGDNSQPITLQVSPSYDTFIYGDKLWLACDLGMNDKSCFIRMFINGKMVAENLHANPLASPDQWRGWHRIIGQDMNYKNGAVFDAAVFLSFDCTTDKDLLQRIPKMLGDLHLENYK